jgi:mercuric reductase
MSDSRGTSDEINGDKPDLVVIGAGSAGFSAAIAAAEQGARVALIGHELIGGTCVNVGCIPSKTLIRAAETLYQARSASRFLGIEAEARLEDWKAVVQQKDALVAELRQGKYADLLLAYDGITYIKGEARLEEGGVRVNGALIANGPIIVTAGARPSLPPIPGIEEVDYLTSTTALDLEELPRSLIVIGGGFIGTELAQLFARVGVKVTIVCRSRLLPAAEPEIGEALSRYFQEEGIGLDCGVTYRFCKRTERGIALGIKRGDKEENLEAERVLIATGRTPNTEGLGLEKAGIKLLPNGGIKVDDRMRTTRPGVYAAGDVTARDQFVYMAAYGARIAAENALNGDGRQYDASAMPAVVYSDPQVASVGLTEAEARALGYDVKKLILPLDAVPRALAARDTRGLIKLVADKKTDRLLGGHILAPEGADSIQTIAMALKGGLTTRDLAETIFPYLTTVEGLKLAAQTFEKDVAMLSCCAG